MILKKLQNLSITFIAKHIGAFLLLIFFISEAIDKIIKRTIGDPMVAAKSVKAIVLVLLLVALLKTDFKKVAYLIIIPIFLFILGYLFLGTAPSTDVILFLIKYLFPIALFGFFTTSSNITHDRRSFFKVFEWIIIINSIIIIVAFLFQLKWFSTYRFKRFGYNGLIYTSAAATYIYIVALYYFFLKHISQKPKLFEVIKVACIFFAAFLVGTKTLLLACFFILGFFIWKFCNPRYKKAIITFMVLTLAAIGYYFFFISNFFGNITKTEGFLTSFLSYRNVLFETKTYPFILENWNIGNYLFGGIRDVSTRTQMSYVDLIYFWGIVGSTYYLIAYLKSYVTMRLSTTDWVFFIFLGIVTFIAGNFFIYATIPIYLVVLRERIVVSQSSEETPTPKLEE